MSQPIFSEPQHWPYRLFIFGMRGRPEAVSMQAFRTPHERDKAARERRYEEGQTAIAVTVDFLINGGDEPKRR